METRCWKACTARGTWAQSGHLFSYAFAEQVATPSVALRKCKFLVWFAWSLSFLVCLLCLSLPPSRASATGVSSLEHAAPAPWLWSASFHPHFAPSRPLFLMRTHAFAVSHWPTAHVAHNDCIPTYINILYVRAAWAGACSLGAPDCQSAALPSAWCADALRSPGQERIGWPFLCHRQPRRAVGCQSSISIFVFCSFCTTHARRPDWQWPDTDGRRTALPTHSSIISSICSQFHDHWRAERLAP